jgi:hypothetical protein
LIPVRLLGGGWEHSIHRPSAEYYSGYFPIVASPFPTTARSAEDDQRRDAAETEPDGVQGFDPISPDSCRDGSKTE